MVVVSSPTKPDIHLQHPLQQMSPSSGSHMPAALPADMLAVAGPSTFANPLNYDHLTVLSTYRPLTHTLTRDSGRASVMTDCTNFSSSSIVNRGYAARIDVNGKVGPLQSSPDPDACQTFAFLDGPSDLLDYKTYRPGDEIKGAVHLLRDDPERGHVTGIKARIRGDLETSIFGAGDSSYYSNNSLHGIARRQMLFFCEEKTLVTRPELDNGTFELQQTGLVDHGRRNNLAVPFSFVLPLKLHASALDLLDSKLKKSFKRGKKHIDLPPSIDMETRYAAPRPHHLFEHVKEKLHGQKLRPMARIRYEIDIIVSRQRMGSDFFPPKRGERIILSFVVEPYPPRTAGLSVPNLDPIRARRQYDERSSMDSTADSTVAQDEEEDDDAWVSNMGGFRPTEEIFGVVPMRELPRLPSSSSNPTVTSRPSLPGSKLPGSKRKSYINVREGLDGRLKGWLTHSHEVELGSGRGSVEAILSVPAMAALYMETKIPFSMELRLPEGLANSYAPQFELSLVRSVMTYSRLGTLVIEKEDPDQLEDFVGTPSWSERIRIVDSQQQSHDHLPPFYEHNRTRQFYTGHFAIGRYEKMQRAGSSTPSRNQKSNLQSELRLVMPSFSFKGLRVEYRLHVKVSLPTSTQKHLVILTPPVHVAANPDTVDFTRHNTGEASSISDALSTVDLLDDEEERLIASSSRPRLSYSATEEEDTSAQATPLVRTPMRRSLDLRPLTAPSPSSIPSTSPEASDEAGPTPFSSLASSVDERMSTLLEMPSLDAIPDDADVDEEDELNEHLALGLIDREHATAVAAQSRRRNTITQDHTSVNLLPSYTDSIGILG